MPDTDELFPASYYSWRYCISEKCKIALTPNFIAQRIVVLSNAHCEETQRFRTLYGDTYWQTVLAWFRQAEADLTQP